MRVAVLVLAGGLGERLGGVRKPTLRLGGMPLLGHLRRALGHTPLLVSTGHHNPALLGLSETDISIPDLRAGNDGPIAGFVAGVAWALAHDAADVIVTTPSDTPFLPPDYVARMVATLGEGPACIAAHGGQIQPPHGAWRPASLRDAPERFFAGQFPRSLKSLHREIGGGVLDWSPLVAADPFSGINTVGDLLAAERRLLEKGHQEFSTGP